MIGAFTINKIPLQKKSLTAHTVITLIVFLVNITILPAKLPNPFCPLVMIGIRGAIEIIITDAKLFAEFLPLWH
jgi:hypothetical protein